VRSRGWLGVGDRTVWGRPRCRWWTRVCRPSTKVIAIAATTTTATHRWTGGVCGRGVGSVWGTGRYGVVLGVGGGRAFVAQAPKSSPSPPPPPLPLVGGRAACAVEGSDRCGGPDGMGSSSSFSGAGGGRAFVAQAPMCDGYRRASRVQPTSRCTPTVVPCPFFVLRICLRGALLRRRDGNCGVFLARAVHLVFEHFREYRRLFEEDLHVHETHVLVLS
jgi:hypothetical protein